MSGQWEMYEMVQAFLQAPIYHLFLEAVLILWIIWLLFMKSYKPDRRHVLTDKEKEELIAEWAPEPLVPETPEDHPALGWKTVSSGIGKTLVVNGKECINMASLNFLGLNGNKDVEEAAIKSLRKYGVGSCGPRGFYGTIDVHLILEERLARFMGVEEAVLYSYGFATIASAIPAYAKRGDVIFCDDGVCFAIQKGLQASRSQVQFFKHNDMDDLERLLKLQAKDDKQNPQKAKVTRRFLIVEGLYANFGDVCPLSQLIEFKYQYKVRLFIEESMSFGVLGETGKGITEYFHIPISHVDLIAVSLENSVAAIGGFTCGKSFVVDHQRLSGLGYCFSASLPPMLAQAALTALDLFESDPDKYQFKKKNTEFLHREFSSIPGITVSGETFSPILHLRLSERCDSRIEAIKKLHRIVDYALNKGVAMTLSHYLERDELHLPLPSIRISINSQLTEPDLKKVASVLRQACDDVLWAEQSPILK